MNERPTDFGTLIARFLEGRLTEQERQELEEQIAASPEKALLYQRLCEADPEGRYEPSQQQLDKAADKLSARMGFDVRTGRLPVRTLVVRYLSVAALLTVAVWGIWLATKKKEPDQLAVQVKQPAHAEKIASDNVTIISSNNDKDITVETKLHEKRSVLLPDGSTILLNAQSSLTYPRVFTDGARHVTLAGEAYFDIVHDEKKPFIVSLAAGQNPSVKVLGTRFNVRMAKNMLPSITLLDGSIVYTAGKQTRMVKPMETLTLDRQYKVISARKIDTAVIVSWRNDQFIFRNADAETVMNELAEAYGMKVWFENRKAVSWFHFGGEFGRRQPLLDILKSLHDDGQLNTSVVNDTIRVLAK